MLDVVVCSLVLILPTLIFSLYQIKIRRNFSLHKRIQIALGVVLFIVVALFEYDMRVQGGFYVLAKDSPWIDKSFMKWLLRVHLCFSISTVFIWAATTILAAIKFPSPPGPSGFSPTHKIMAWTSVIDMVCTVVTGLMVYYFGFIAS